MVTYRNERTIRVQPAPEERLRRRPRQIAESAPSADGCAVSVASPAPDRRGGRPCRRLRSGCPLQSVVSPTSGIRSRRDMRNPPKVSIVAVLLARQWIVDLEHSRTSCTGSAPSSSHEPSVPAHDLAARVPARRQVAGDGLHEVMQGDQPLDSAVFVDDHRRVAARGRGSAPAPPGPASTRARSGPARSARASRSARR